MTALTQIRKLKERMIEAQQFDLSADLRKIERQLNLEQRDNEELVTDLVDTGIAMRGLYYEDVADPIPMLGRMAQVAEVIAMGKFERVPAHD